MEEAPKSVGIQETEDVIKLLDDFADVVKSAKADGKLDLFDAFSLLTLSPSIAAAVSGSSRIPAELSDLSGEELEKLLNEMKSAVLKIVSALL